MRQGIVKYNNELAGRIIEEDKGEYVFVYDDEYCQKYPSQFITFNMPVTQHPYRSTRLFPFFDGLIPEGWLLNIAAESWKINKNDRMGLLLACCQNVIGAVSIHPVTDKEDA
ncbi:HipA N-terminal domain-containing protein [uncultured Cytophaga sp.]|uniref:HipA N-terminal domain-containing protein n=1 Tax=uncultured Cytophaga sp. TaxID=160238 RepID=UPI0026333350|nr:HipA N-terminal domain-containing protein [uncultured Cytophaga sp.]